MQARWKASLSNGETFYEGKGKFEVIPKELSPWLRLLWYIEEENVKNELENPLEITSLGIYTDDGRNFNLPSAGKSPKFSAFAIKEKPDSFNMFKTSAYTIVISGNQKKHEENFIVVEAIYRTGKLQMWVSDDSLNCWCLFIPADSES